MESKKPRKQRVKLTKMPLHQKKRQVCANLSKELRKSLKKRSLPVRKGDTVKILRGKFKGKTGKVMRVELAKARVYIEKISRKKVDGTEVPVPFDASNLQIVTLDGSDERRIKQVGGKKG